jgi:hypothetical protein
MVETLSLCPRDNVSPACEGCHRDIRTGKVVVPHGFKCPILYPGKKAYEVDTDSSIPEYLKTKLRSGYGVSGTKVT